MATAEVKLSFPEQVKESRKKIRDCFKRYHGALQERENILHSRVDEIEREYNRKTDKMNKLIKSLNKNKSLTTDTLTDNELHEIHQTLCSVIDTKIQALTISTYTSVEFDWDIQFDNVIEQLGSIKLNGQTDLFPTKQLSTVCAEAGEVQKLVDKQELMEIQANQDAGETGCITAEAALQQIKESEKLMQVLSLPWQEKLDEAEKRMQEMEDYMKQMGIPITLWEDGATKDVKATIVAFDESDLEWHPKDIPVYPYRHHDVIQQCYLGTNEVTEFAEQPRKTSSSPKLLRRSNSHTHRDTISSENGGGRSSVSSEDVLKTKPLSFPMDDLLNECDPPFPDDCATPPISAVYKNALPLQYSNTLLTEPQSAKDSMQYADTEPTPMNEENPKPELSIQFSKLMSPTCISPPPSSESFSLLDTEPLLSGAEPGDVLGREGSESISSSDYHSQTRSFFEPSRISASHLTIGKYIRVKVKILRVKNLDKNCANLLFQNRFLYANQESYSSNIYTNDGDCCEINLLQVYRIKVTLHFLEYSYTRGFMIEVFGHYEQHPLHTESQSSHTIQPVKSAATSRTGLTVPYQNISSAQPVARYDVIMNLQICELNLQGDYIPVPVTHVRETNGSFFLLQQGLQRRLVLSFVYDSNIELKMKKVKEVVVGRIRNQLKPTSEDEDSSLTINVSSAEFIDLNNDSRTVFRIQVAWDTSLHHTKLLNMRTPINVLVHATMSVYIEVEKCIQPACFTINFSLQITKRQKKKKGSSLLLEALFPSQHRAENNCVAGLYEVALHRTTESFSHKGIPSFDNQRVCWQPGGTSLIYEHQNQVKRLRDIEQVERVKHMLTIREKVKESEEKVTISQSVDKLLNKCLFLWKFHISPFLEEHLTVEDILKHPTYSTKSETSQKRCVPLVHDISHKKSCQTVKKGYIQLSEYEGLWRKFYAVLKRPYIFLYYNDKDPIVRDFINFSTAKLQFNQDHLDAQTGASVFSFCTKYRGFLCKTQDFEGWINSLDPLSSGALVSKSRYKK